MTTEKITIQVPVELDDQFFEDIIVTMFEGGSNYWIYHVKINHPGGAKPKDIPTSLWAAQALNNGGSVKVYPNDDRETADGRTFNKGDLVAGLVEWTRKHPSQVSIVSEVGKITIDAGDIDADDADAILQYALFGEIVYG